MLQEDAIPPGCFKSEVKVKERRHFLFATKEQLQQLDFSKTWYMDGMFKVVSQPFKQLLTINASVRSADSVKQVPLVFVVMSGQRKRDYKKASLLHIFNGYIMGHTGS